MPRYIDADKLKARLLDAKHLFCKNQIEFRALPLNDKARVDEIDNLISLVINFPTADVVGRKRGKWIYHDAREGFLIPKYTCSVCIYYSGTNRTNFCPGCGADMREEKTDED